MKDTAGKFCNEAIKEKLQSNRRQQSIWSQRHHIISNCFFLIKVAMSY